MDQKQLYSVAPLGDSAMLISLGNEINDNINIKVLEIFGQLKKAAIKGIRDIVPAYCSLAIYYDPITVPGDISAYEYFSGQIISILYMQDELSQELYEMIRVPVCYADKYGLDIRSLAVAKNLSVEDVIKIHTGKTYRVYMIGFLPGFPYMGEVDERIRMPRLQEPRKRIRAGSVGIADKQTGIYPLDSPGGWQIIGKTPLALFSKDSDHPILFEPGQEVEFYSITEDELENY